MKAVKTAGVPSSLVAVIGMGGGLFFAGRTDGHGVTYIDTAGRTKTGQSGTLEQLLLDPSRTGIYKGDTVTITF